MNDGLPTADDVRAAARRLAGVVRDTPLLADTPLDGAQLVAAVLRPGAGEQAALADPVELGRHFAGLGI